MRTRHLYVQNERARQKRIRDRRYIICGGAKPNVACINTNIWQTLLAEVFCAFNFKIRLKRWKWIVTFTTHNLIDLIEDNYWVCDYT